MHSENSLARVSFNLVWILGSDQPHLVPPPLEIVEPIDRKDPVDPLAQFDELEAEVYELREKLEAQGARVELLHDENCGRLRRLEGYDF